MKSNIFFLTVSLRVLEFFSHTIVSVIICRRFVRMLCTCVNSDGLKQGYHYTVQSSRCVHSPFKVFTSSNDEQQIQQQQMSLFHCPSLSCRSLRSSTTGVLLINLCLALISLYISFIISYYVLVPEEACAAFSFVFHYLVLVSSFALTTMAVFRVLDPLRRKVVFGLAIAADWCKLISLSSIECQHVFFMLSVVVLCLSFLFLCAVIPVVIVAVSFGPRYTNYISDEL